MAVNIQRIRKRVPAQDYNQRDYTGVQEEIEAQNRAEIEEKLKRKYGEEAINRECEAQRDDGRE